MNKINNSIAERLMLEPCFHYTRHALLQLALLIVCFRLFSSQTPELFTFSIGNLLMCIGNYLLLNVCCYVNIYILVPSLSRNGYLGLYAINVVALSLLTFFGLVLCFAKSPFADLESTNINAQHDLLSLVSLFIHVMFISLSVSSFMLLRMWFTEQRRISFLRAESMAAELTLLKQQINPHFLFNMLNNANVLLRRNPAEASRILLRLEDLLRYQLSDSVRESVALSSDIRFLGDFLNLEKVRRDKFSYSIDVEGDIDNIKVAPLLFIPFVENAVKHNTDSVRESWVQICFRHSGENLTFVCRNSKSGEERKNDVGGIGMQNIRRRLELLYPTTHQMTIENNENDFSVTLTIRL